jgi:hypothetical protein
MIRSVALALSLLVTLPSLALAEPVSQPDQQALDVYNEAISAPEIDAPQPKTTISSIAKAVATLRQAFDHEGRKMLEGRVKLVHGGNKDQAAMGVLRFVPANGGDNGMGGFLKEGGLVVARASETFPGRKKSFAPGLSIMRFGQAGEKPLNGFFLQSLRGQGKDRNYFANAFSNDLRPKKALTRALFEVVQSPVRLLTWHPTKSPLGQSVAFIRADQFAMDFDADGNGRSAGKALSKLTLEPSAEAKSLIPAGSKASLAKNLEQVNVGTKTHDVYADGKLVGHFEVAKPFVGTQHRLYVKHPRGNPGTRYNRRK